MITIAEEIASLKLGDPVRYMKLSIIPIFRPSGIMPQADYVLLEQAIEMGTARVTEVNGGGSVPELRFENLGDRPVLLLDGEELIGAKQNRVLNLSILIGARQVVPIPVSCVEAGRWQMQHPEFQAGPAMMYAAARAKRASQVSMNMRMSGSRRSDQSSVWEDIAGKAERLNSCSPTGAMNAIFERHVHTLEHYVRAFAWQEKQAGAVFTIGSAFMGLELFDNATSMRHLYPKLVRSYALDALDPEVSGDSASDEPEVTRFLQRVSSAPIFDEPSLGIGKDVRIGAMGVSGARSGGGPVPTTLCLLS